MTNPLRLRIIPYNARLVDARKGQGWTQKDLWRMTGIKITSISHIETLRLIPSQEAIDEICSALDLTEDYLFPSSLMGALRDGLFDNRLVDLEESQIVRLADNRRAGLLTAGVEDDALEVIEGIVDREFLKLTIDEILETIPPREKKVLEFRFGLKDGRARTHEEVGREFNLTKERIRQIESKALRHLRHPSRSRKLRRYI